MSNLQQGHFAWAAPAAGEPRLSDTLASIERLAETLTFLDGAFADVMRLLSAYDELRDVAADGGRVSETLGRIAELESDCDLEQLGQQLPAALLRARAGIDRVASAVQTIGANHEVVVAGGP